MTTEIYLLLGIAVFSLYMYLLLDGYDLGIGMMLPFAGGNRERKQMMKQVGTSWDANEGWLILLALALWGGFPEAYSTLLPGNYLYFILMLSGFVIRGMAIEFQSDYIDYNRYWGNIFFVSSCLVAICQGLIFGEVMSRFTDSNRMAPWLVMLLCNVLLLLVYCVSGMAWQYLKTKDVLAKRTAVNGKITLLLLLLVIGLVGLLLHYHFLDHQVRLQSFSNGIFFKLVVAFAFGCYSFIFFLFLKKEIKRYALPFIFCSIAVLAGLIAMGIYMFPYFLPPEVTIKSAAAPSASSLRFLIYGILGCMPVVLAYNIYAVYVFRGRNPL